MKHIYSLLCGLCCSSVLLTGCIDETVPTNGATQAQIESSAKSLEATLWALPVGALDYGALGHYDFGYGAQMHIRDIMTQDMPIANSPYDQFFNWERNTYLGDAYRLGQVTWNFYTNYVLKANKMIGAVPEGETDKTKLGYQAAGYAYRAMLYLDMARLYEFLPNDVTNSVNKDGKDVTGLTVPIVTEKTTEEEARNNPRATKEKMIEFILSDLDKAEANISSLTASVNAAKDFPDIAAIYGLKARLYLWTGDYAKAEEYARKAIDNSKCTPTTEEQWLSVTSGFNTLSTPSWMWGIQAVKENDVVQTGIINWVSWTSNEQEFGYAGPGAGCFTEIDKSLYDQISDDDFRKLSWIAPKGSALYGKEQLIDEDYRAVLPAYASLKFRPAQGNTSDYNVAASAAFPLMRIEEMYFIEAEAAAHQDAAKGKQLLEKFMQTYRYKAYTCKATTQDDVIKEIILQKRIEFWGEGLTFFDIKRLNYSVTRGYVGSNFKAATRFNTNGRPGWMNFVIVQTEQNNNKGVVGYNNPDASGLYTSN